MASLREIQDTCDAALEALNAARGRLTVVREEARTAISTLAALEAQALNGAVDPEALQAARDRRVTALAALDEVQGELGVASTLGL